MNETKFADSGEEESLGRFAQYIDYPKEMPFPNMRFECGGPGQGAGGKIPVAVNHTPRIHAGESRPPVHVTTDVARVHKNALSTSWSVPSVKKKVL